MTLTTARLDFGYRTRLVGRDVELSLEPGEIVALLGPNGSGKTTLLRTLLGVLAPISGQVRLDGRALAEWSARERARRVAYVPQAAASDFDFTVGEIVAMGRTAHLGPFSGPGAADARAVEGALARVGIAHLADRPMNGVSGGERQLALLARALATGAPCLLMDEPTANLDFGNQARVLDEIAKLRADGSAVLFSTHHPEHALRIADRAVLLKDGHVIGAGPAKTVLDTAALSRLYGRPIRVVESSGLRLIYSAQTPPEDATDGRSSPKGNP
ncbi:MAG TPA: ABC transporter ATP-binding protein [Usitatibacter sp.]|nr:ABC transporter ATP-binding protein [Usitatibacter sp.]